MSKHSQRCRITVRHNNQPRYVTKLRLICCLEDLMVVIKPKTKYDAASHMVSVALFRIKNGQRISL
jgi:hypothetical protein